MMHVFSWYCEESQPVLVKKRKGKKARIDYAERCIRKSLILTEDEAECVKTALEGASYPLRNVLIKLMGRNPSMVQLERGNIQSGYQPTSSYAQTK